MAIAGLLFINTDLNKGESDAFNDFLMHQVRVTTTTEPMIPEASAAVR